MNLRLVRARRKAPCPAKLRYAKDMLRDLTQLIDTLQDPREAGRLGRLVHEAESEAARQLAKYEQANAGPCADRRVNGAGNEPRRSTFPHHISPDNRRRMMSEATTTTDHEEIRKWVEARDGHPARVKGSGEGGILRIDFGEPDDDLEKIEWDRFFEIFDENNLAFLYQDKTKDGGTSRFNKFVER